MANTIHLDVVSAEQSIYSGDVEFVSVPAKMGELGIYPHHTPLITTIKPGELRLKLDGQKDQSIFVSGGLLEIQPGVVTVLADTALRADDLDEAKALEAKQAAEASMKNKASAADYAKAQAELSQAMAQLNLIEKMRRTKTH